MRWVTFSIFFIQAFVQVHETFCLYLLLVELLKLDLVSLIDSKSKRSFPALWHLNQTNKRTLNVSLPVNQCFGIVVQAGNQKQQKLFKMRLLGVSS